MVIPATWWIALSDAYCRHAAWLTKPLQHHKPTIILTSPFAPSTILIVSYLDLSRTQSFQINTFNTNGIAVRAPEVPMQPRFCTETECWARLLHHVSGLKKKKETKKRDRGLATVLSYFLRVNVGLGRVWKFLCSRRCRPQNGENILKRNDLRSIQNGTPATRAT